jgi:malate dehydrogenase (oxaloacetate-decarboxylating)
MNVKKESLKLHKRLRGKIEIKSKVRIKKKLDLTLAYTPGVAEACKDIARNRKKLFEYTIKNNSVGVVTDGSAVLGLGDIGAEAALPVMEGKALLFKEFAGIDAFPVCVEAKSADEIVNIVKKISAVFGGINLEDISAPKCFEVEKKLQDIGIPVMHDDQHGTAVVVLAALINALKVTGKKMDELCVAVSGAGAASTAITKMLLCSGMEDEIYKPVKQIILCDSRGVINKRRKDMNKYKRELACITNPDGREGFLEEAVRGADVFIGVSAGNILTRKMIKTMAEDPIIFALANPDPEILPAKAKGAAAIIATGRSDFPNQVNNVFGFPGIFRGALDAGAVKINAKMKLAAAHTLAGCVENPKKDKILPAFGETKKAALMIAKAVAEAAAESGVIRK